MIIAMKCEYLGVLIIIITPAMGWRIISVFIKHNGQGGTEGGSKLIIESDCNNVK